MRSTTLPRRRWLSYGLRTLFALVVLSAILFGGLVSWIEAQREWIRNRHEALEGYATRYTVFSNWKSPVVPAPWSLRFFGETGVEAVVIDRDEPEETRKSARKRLEPLFPEAKIEEDDLPK